MKSFSVSDRSQNLKKMEAEEFDLCIVGGGITGAGVARDAALRGMKVALVEASDFASGTSSRSSKLIHGGIRYLENYEFKLVFEALTERQLLFEIAPHLVHPLRFMIPLYQEGRVGMGLMGLGMWAYDALSLFQAPELHERLSASESTQRLGVLQATGLMGSYVYSDAYMDDDRLTIETLRSAHAAGACCAHYVKAVGAQKSPDGKVTALQVQDLRSQKKLFIRAKHFVSCAGPWTDFVGGTFDDKWKNLLRPTKGIHLTFPKGKIPLSCAVVMAAEKRIVFAIPRHEMVIVGTTDTDYSGDPGAVSTTREDVKYLLGVIAQYFPGVNVSEKDIIASYAGVRPLVWDGSESEGKTSREHTILTRENGVTYVAGGKYTTYRLMAEQIVEECLQHFPIEEKVRFGRSSTRRPINPLISEESRQEDFKIRQRLVATNKLTDSEVCSLMIRHSSEAWSIWTHARKKTYWSAEVSHAISNGMCDNLLDFYARRSSLILAESDHGLSSLNEISTEFSEILNWDHTKKQHQEAQLKSYLESEFAWRHKIV